MKTNIYIDNDGVINIIRQKYNAEVTGWENHSTGYAYSGGMRYRIMWAIELVEALNRIDKLDDVEVVVLSTWMGEFLTKIAPMIGLDNLSWRVLTNNVNDEQIIGWDTSRSHDWWKLRAIKYDIDLYNPDQAIWIDDDLVYEDVAVRWALEKGNITLVVPEQHVGITRAHTELIEDIILNGMTPTEIESTME